MATTSVPVTVKRGEPMFDPNSHVDIGYSVTPTETASLSLHKLMRERDFKAIAHLFQISRDFNFELKAPTLNQNSTYGKVVDVYDIGFARVQSWDAYEQVTKVQFVAGIGGTPHTSEGMEKLHPAGSILAWAVIMGLALYSTFVTWILWTVTN